MSIFFFNDTATTEIYTLSLHDALPISAPRLRAPPRADRARDALAPSDALRSATWRSRRGSWTWTACSCTRSARRSEEHTSELQSRQYLVCRLLLEKKKKSNRISILDY